MGLCLVALWSGVWRGMGQEVEGKTPELQGDEGPAPKVAPQRGAPGKQRQRGLLLPSLAGTEELFRGKGFSFFLSKPALREDESLPAWVAQCSHGAGDLGAPWPLFGVFWVSFPAEMHPCPTFLTPGALFALTAQVGAGRSCLTKTFGRDRPVP